MRVPLFDGRREFEAFRPALMEAAERVLSSGNYILGEEVEAFERAVERYLGGGHVVGVASGTDALMIALRALGVGRGDRVITTPFSFIATADAVVNCGAEPVFVDVEPDTLNIDPTAVRLVLEGRSPVHRRLGIRPETVKAVLPVHLYGQPADLDEICGLARQFGLRVIEDAAQAMGARYRERFAGTIGDVGCFSLFPTKNLGGFGDGGFVFSHDRELAHRARLIRVHGAADKYRYSILGVNSRLDALQAALVRVRLEHLESALMARRAHADGYDRGLGVVEGLTRPPRRPRRQHTFQQYVVRIEGGRRDQVAAALSRSGIATAVHYPVALHRQEALSGLGYRDGDLPIAEEATHQVLSLPLFPTLTEPEREYVVEVLRVQLDSSTTSRVGSLPSGRRP